MFVSNYPPVRLPMALYSQCKINAYASLCLRVNRASIACAANAAPSVPNGFKRRAVTTRALRASQPMRTACSLAAACQCLRGALHLIDFHGHVIFSQEKKTFVSPATVATLARCVAGVIMSFLVGLHHAPHNWISVANVSDECCNGCASCNPLHFCLERSRTTQLSIAVWSFGN
jgi:hypothetical protein